MFGELVFMCRCNGESVAHLLLHCDVVFGL